MKNPGQAPDSASQTACSVGGNVAVNSGGPHCLKYGVTTNHVLGLEIVLASGRSSKSGAGRRTRLAATGADAVVTGNPGCLLQIAAGLRECAMPMRAAHTIEILDRSYRGVTP